MTLEKDHGRIEKRKYYVTTDIDWIENTADWAGLGSIGGNIRQEHKWQKQQCKQDIRFQLWLRMRKNFVKAIRGHWGMENSLP